MIKFELGKIFSPLPPKFASSNLPRRRYSGIILTYLAKYSNTSPPFHCCVLLVLHRSHHPDQYIGINLHRQHVFEVAKAEFEEWRIF